MFVHTCYSSSWSSFSLNVLVLTTASHMKRYWNDGNIWIFFHLMEIHVCSKQWDSKANFQKDVLLNSHGFHTNSKNCSSDEVMPSFMQDIVHIITKLKTKLLNRDNKLILEQFEASVLDLENIIEATPKTNIYW